MTHQGVAVATKIGRRAAAVRLGAQGAGQAHFHALGRFRAQHFAQGGEAAHLDEGQLQLQAGGLAGFEQGRRDGLKARLVVQAVAGVGGRAAEGAGDGAVVAGQAEHRHGRGAFDAAVSGQGDHQGPAALAIGQAVDQSLNHVAVPGVDEIAPAASHQGGFTRSRQGFAGPNRKGDLAVGGDLEKQIGVGERKSE